MISSLLAALIIGYTPVMPLSIAATDNAFSIFANPAGLGASEGSQFFFAYNFQQVGWSEFFTNTSFVASAGPVAAFWEPKPSRYGLALGGGDKGIYAGIKWSRDKVNRWDAGLMARPIKQVSLGLVWEDLNRDWGRVRVGAAARPLGNRLTIFAETWLTDPLIPMFGAEVEPLDGLKLAARAVYRPTFDEFAYTAGVTIGLGKGSVGAVGTIDPTEVGGVIGISSEKRRTLLTFGKRWLDVKLSGAVAEQKSGFSLMGSSSSRTTWSLLQLLSDAKKDASVQAIVLRFEGVSMSLAQAQEVRKAILDFKAGGRKVYACGAGFDMLDYYLASTADRIVGHPLGGVTIPGVSAQPLFLKGTLEKLGLVFDARRHGKYKSAVEMFTMDSLSEPNREQLQAYIDALYEELLAGIGAGRNKSRADVESLVNRAYFNSVQAKAAGLLDTCVYDDQLDSLFKVELKGLRRQTEKDFLQSRVASEDWRPKPAVAIIYAVGSIADGESRTDFLTGEPTMGARTMVRAIRQARKDKRVKAIVLRIDSPGGDGFASDLIWRELELARQKKPVIASMGAVAGSGGYYIACNATRVFADATTLTGSIGVFDAKFVTEGLYNKFGARRQVVKRGEHADAQSDFRALTPEEDSMMQDQIDWWYRQFVQKVADGRHLTFEKVDSVGQGRIWAGIDGRKVGIVDELGGFLDAVEYAKKAAKLNDCDFEFYPKPKSGMSEAFSNAAQEQVRKAFQ